MNDHALGAMVPARSVSYTGGPSLGWSTRPTALFQTEVKTVWSVFMTARDGWSMSG